MAFDFTSELLVKGPPSSYGSKFHTWAQEAHFREVGQKTGCEIIYASAVVADPTAGPSLFIKNSGSKLVRVGKDLFLEPGEKATVPYDEGIQIVALNNGV